MPKKRARVASKSGQSKKKRLSTASSAGLASSAKQDAAKLAEAVPDSENWWQLAQSDETLLQQYQVEEKTTGVSKELFFSWLAKYGGKQMSLLHYKFLRMTSKNDQIDWDSLLHGLKFRHIEAGIVIFLKLRLAFGDLSTIDDDSDSLNKIGTVLSGLLPRSTGAAKHDGHEQDKLRLAFDKPEVCGVQESSPSLSLLTRLDALRAKFDQNPTGFLSPYTALVAPSGTGKSFSIKHIAATHNRYVFYACVGPKTARSMPASTPLADAISGLHYSAAALRFFQSLVNIAHDLVAVAKTKGVSPGMLFQLQADDTFSGFQKSLASLISSSYPTRKRKEALDTMLQSTIGEYDLPANARADAQHADGPLLICLDEARSLLARPSDDAREPAPLLLRAFRQALHVKSVEKTFAVLLDTSSKVANFVPPIRLDPSLKSVGEHGDLLPPIYTLPTWDVTARASPYVQSWLSLALPQRRHQTALPSVKGKETTAAPNIRLARLCSGPDGSTDFQLFLYSLGRPLWASMIQAHVEIANGENDGQVWLDGSAEQDALNDTFKLARRKICADEDIRPLALLSYRLQFHIEQQDLVNELTANWMWFPVHVSDDRHYVKSIQPGEPILAAAAAFEMRDTRDGGCGMHCIVQGFFKYYNDGVTNVGDVGEMVASLLLLWAFDAASIPRTAPVPPPPARFATAIPLTTFLGSLLGSAPPPEWIGAGRDAHVFLTHITRLCPDSDSGHLTCAQLEMGFLTGEGWLLEKCHEGADMLLPVWCKESGRMTALLLQIKNRKLRRSASASVPDAATAVPVAPASMVRDAWNALSTARLSLQEALGDVHVYGLFLDLGGDDDRATLPVQWLARGNSTRDSKLSVAVARGCRAAVFPVLQEHEEAADQLRAMLSRGRADMGGDVAVQSMVQTRDGSTLLQ